MPGKPLWKALEIYKDYYYQDYSKVFPAGYSCCHVMIQFFSFLSGQMVIFLNHYLFLYFHLWALTGDKCKMHRITKTTKTFRYTSSSYLRQRGHSRRLYFARYGSTEDPWEKDNDPLKLSVWVTSTSHRSGFGGRLKIQVQVMYIKFIIHNLSWIWALFSGSLMIDDE